MVSFYDKHDKQYEAYVKNEKQYKIAEAWLNLESLDYWRHNRILNLIRPILKKNETWLTIGDGRYGSEAAWLKRHDIVCHSSDMHTNLLELAYKKGIVDSFSEQNAENLNLESNSFDYVLIKETLHHLPRPWLAIYEAFRVCKKGVVIIEPNDTYAYSHCFKKTFIRSKNLLKKLLNKKVYKDEYGFEEVGNFIYTINMRELEKFLLGIHKTRIAFNNINDHYFENIEYISTKNASFKEKVICLKLKSMILIKDLLCNLGFMNFSIGEAILFKEKPEKKLIYDLKNMNWNYKNLPNNPFL